MDKQQAISQFEIIEKSLSRAKLQFQADMQDIDTTKEVILYELIKSHLQIENIIREFAPERFGKIVREVRTLVTPNITMDSLHICTTCGETWCTSDHK